MPPMIFPAFDENIYKGCRNNSSIAAVEFSAWSAICADIRAKEASG
jgi:hypothetical protein